jgi:hypothetical protein
LTLKMGVLCSSIMAFFKLHAITTEKAILFIDDFFSV